MGTRWRKGHCRRHLPGRMMCTTLASVPTCLPEAQTLLTCMMYTMLLEPAMWLPLFIFLPQTMRDLRIVPIDQKHASLNLHKKTHKLVSGRTRVSLCPATHPTLHWQTTGLEILCWISRGIWRSRWLHRTGIPREPVIHRLEVLVQQTRSTKLWTKSIRPWTAQKATMATQHSVHPP